jgi:predicted transcriptional regulator
MQLERNMSAGRSRTLPPLRVSEKMRADAESVLTPGETLSAFVMDAVSRSIDFRRSQQDFVARGLASADRARESGRYVSASKVLAGLRRRLVRARRAHA